MAHGGVIATAVKHLIAAGVQGDALLAAIADMEAAIDSRSTGAKRQARYRERNKASQTVTSVTSDAEPPSPNKSPPDPQKLTPTPVPAGRVILARARFGAPDGVSEEQWAGFLRLRTAKRQPMTERGYSLLCGKLRGIAEHGWPPGDMIDLAIERGWTTVHEPKDDRNGRTNHDKPSGWQTAYLANSGSGEPL